MPGRYSVTYISVQSSGRYKIDINVFWILGTRLEHIDLNLNQVRNLRFLVTDLLGMES